MLFRLASILLLLVWGIGFANEDLRIGDSCYFSRAENAIDDKADFKNVHKMIQAYEKALKDSSVHEKATEGLLNSYYFMLRFASPEKKSVKSF
jgi:hypothetical protein